MAGSSLSAQHATAFDIEDGGRAFRNTCANCHGPDGDRIAGKELKSVHARMSAEQLATFILNPTGAMPKLFPEPRTTDDERDIRDVAAFVTAWPR